MPMRRRMALRSVFGAIMSTPSTKIDPLLGSSSRLRQARNVLLPEPDGPIMNTSSCGATARSMPRNTSWVPNDFHSARTSRIGAAISRRPAQVRGKIPADPLLDVFRRGAHAFARELMEDRGVAARQLLDHLGRRLGQRRILVRVAVVHEPQAQEFLVEI